ncbi:TOMM precursor leader peptide-binding protein [Kitasatospora sp. NBC_01266]|uniref:TOMM precursor leader peptide-binding protein n=1 Tax=Kitasatospora sp. NBC_01266 TaxID=2903572 RepID=UPI002E30A824|nr:TOMM precursor leader peptide-binding protein [Kitasatospora sp. NBC_01266]
MATAYDETAETRPRLRRDILFTETASGVLFHNAQGGFSLNGRSAYRFASLFVPHFDGGTTVAALAEGLGEGQRDLLAGLVAALYRHGFARDAAVRGGTAEPGPAPEVAARFAAQIAYVDHYADNDGARFQRFRDTRVAVLGDDPSARWCALGLLRNGCAAVGVLDGPGLDEVLDEARALTEAGCPVSVERLAAGADRSGADRVGRAVTGWAELDGYDLVVVTGGTLGARRLSRLLAEGVPAGRTLLPAWTFGRRAVIGPLMESGTAGCWLCAVLRLGANGTAAASAALWRGIAPDAPLGPEQPEPSGPLAGMLGNLLGFEVFRHTTGALPTETAGRLIIQDLDSLDVVSERLLAHPRCPYCALSPVTGGVDAAAASGLPALDEDASTPDEAASAPHEGASTGLPDAAGEEATKAALAELTVRESLIGARAGLFDGFHDEEWSQSPLKVGTVGLGVGDGQCRQVSAFDLHHVAAARLRGLRRAAETYAEHVVPVAGVLNAGEAAAVGVKWPLIAPERLGTASGNGMGIDQIARWAPATSLISARTVLVPAAALRTFGPDNRDRVCELTSAGTGAGADAAAAIRRGLRTALSYDVLRQALRRAVPVSRVDPESFAEDVELTFLARSAKNLGVDLELLELGEPARRAVPVMLARCADRATGAWQWAAGSSPHRSRAAREAVRELLGRVQLGRQSGVEGAVDTGDPLFGDLDAGAIAVSAEGLAGGGGDCAAVSWADVLDRLHRGGRDVLVAPVPAPDLGVGGISVARVLLVEGGGRDEH